MGHNLSYSHPKGSFFNEIKLHPNKVCNTIRSKEYPYHYLIPRKLNNNEGIKIGSFPKDYNFLNLKPVYLIGMSVPPIMTAQIASNIYEQWLSKIN
jgi:DNA (cytosine-5)-methyltransferase 1